MTSIWTPGTRPTNKPENYYYFCDVERQQHARTREEYEQEEGFEPVLAAPGVIIRTNRNSDCNAFHRKYHGMIEREALVTELLLTEHCLDGGDPIAVKEAVEE